VSATEALDKVDSWDLETNSPAQSKAVADKQLTPEEIEKAALDAQVAENEANGQTMEEYLAEQAAKASASAVREARKPNTTQDNKTKALTRPEEESLFDRVEVRCSLYRCCNKD